MITENMLEVVCLDADPQFRLIGVKLSEIRIVAVGLLTALTRAPQVTAVDTARVYLDADTGGLV